ncbi:MAG: hypothetical protein JWM57_315 [Phycisphaerales bacterium]|nr:hypothetical protein [Phycisphaerales bacterium]
MKSIHIRGHYDEEESAAYFDAHYSGTQSMVAFPLGCAGLCSFWYALHEYQFGLVATAILSLFFAWKYRQHSTSRRKQWLRQMLDRPYDVSAIVDDHGVTFSTAHSVHDYTWPAFDDFAESLKFFSLSSQRQIILYMPKRLMSAEDQASFRDRALRAIRPKQQPGQTFGFPVVPLSDDADS